ncbi:MAG: hypothetical protein IKT20_00975 [Clostridiales bacterium]|nr:hypothetical protein [Clostridiales bacterium]
MLKLFEKPYWRFSTFAGYPCYQCSKCNYTFGTPRPFCGSCGKKVLKIKKEPLKD